MNFDSSSLECEKNQAKMTFALQVHSCTHTSLNCGSSQTTSPTRLFWGRRFQSKSLQRQKRSFLRAPGSLRPDKGRPESEVTSPVPPPPPPPPQVFSPASHTSTTSGRRSDGASRHFGLNWRLLEGDEGFWDGTNLTPVLFGTFQTF